MTTTETTNRTSETKFTRRKMLQVLPLTSVAIASSAMAVAAVPDRPSDDEPSEALLDLIEAHHRAWELFGDAVTAADDMHPEYEGTEAEAIANILCDAELEARHLLLAFPVTSLADAQAKTSYLTGGKYDLDQDDIATLLRSIASPDHVPAMAPALRPSTTSPETVDPVFAAIAALEAADKWSSAAYEALDDAERAARAKHGNRPHELIAWRHYSAIGGSEIDDRRELFLGLPGMDPAQIELEYQDAKRRYAARVQEAGAWDERAGTVALRRENEQAKASFWEATEVIAETMPTSLAGAHALLDLVAKELEFNDDAWMRQALQNAVAAIRDLGTTRAGAV